MSYRDKRSRILFAITATFVIFGSTASNALPPQATAEEGEKRARLFPMISSGSNALTVFLRTSPIRRMQRTSQRMRGIGKSRRANRQLTAARKSSQQT